MRKIQKNKYMKKRKNTTKELGKINGETLYYDDYKEKELIDLDKMLEEN